MAINESYFANQDYHSHSFKFIFVLKQIPKISRQFQQKYIKKLEKEDLLRATKQNLGSMLAKDLDKYFQKKLERKNIILQKQIRNDLKNYHQNKSLIKIQRWWRYIIQTKFNAFLKNWTDSDLISLQVVSKIPRSNLYIYCGSDNYWRGGDIFYLLEWVSKCEYYSIPINPYLNRNFTQNELEKLFEKVLIILEKADYEINISQGGLGNAVEDSEHHFQRYIKTLEIAKENNHARLNPIKYYNQLVKNQVEIINELKDVFCILVENKSNLEYHYLQLMSVQKLDPNLPILTGNLIHYMASYLSSQYHIYYLQLIDKVYNLEKRINFHYNLFMFDQQFPFQSYLTTILVF